MVPQPKQENMQTRQKVNKLRRLQRDADAIRQELGIRARGELTYQAELEEVFRQMSPAGGEEANPTDSD
jgi:hypothetical protein